MRRLRAVLCLCLGLAFWGCGDSCPADWIEIRPFSGPSIDGTSIECEGEGVATWPACVYTTCSRPFLAPPDLPQCGDVEVALGSYRFLSQNVTISLWGQGTLDMAAALSIANTDDQDAPRPVPSPVLDGHISVQEFSRDGRNRGSFELVFEEGTISGTYDVVFPPPAEGNEDCERPQ